MYNVVIQDTGDDKMAGADDDEEKQKGLNQFTII